jgi:TetR/AcrR family transcriptional regulator of autoinduction and epiphytic fitness
VGEPAGEAASAGGDTPSGTLDGRSARAERSRRSVVEAMLDLLDEGAVDPTAQQVADRAEVSLRTVFHHFQSMEAVFTECWKLQMQRHWTEQSLPRVPPDGALAVRIEHAVVGRVQLYEAVAGPRRAGMHRAQESPILAKGLHDSAAGLRRLLAETFAPELAADDQAEVLLDALDVALSFEAWDRLRRQEGRDTETTTTVLLRSATALLT